MFGANPPTARFGGMQPQRPTVQNPIARPVGGFGGPTAAPQPTAPIASPLGGFRPTAPQAPQPTAPIARPNLPFVGSMKKGGLIRKTGLYHMHEGELVAPASKVGTLTAAKRKAVPTSEFGLPGSRKYPMPDKSHAANAKARATQQVRAGNLSSSSASQIRAKANRILGHGQKMKSVSALTA
jgi:hypothetical protein